MSNEKRPGIVRRKDGPRRGLSPEQEAFAAGDDDAIWRRTQRPRVHDPRPVVLVPGVKNADARVVYEKRLAELREALQANDEAELAVRLAEADVLELHRAGAIVGFDVFIDAVLGMPLDRAQALVNEGRKKLELDERLIESDIAVWLRAEAGMIEAGAAGRVRIRAGTIRLDLPIDLAAHALTAIGRREAPMATQPPKKSVIDRPLGVSSMKTIIERHEGREPTHPKKRTPRPR